MTKHRQVRLPDTLDEQVERYRRRTGETRSEVLRELLTAALAQRGMWPPPPG